MEYTIKKIDIKSLNQFYTSKLYNKSNIIPISKNRINSYINNPRADSDDFVLYMAIFNNEIIGFRTILADSIFIDTKKYKFGWFSGSWVSSKHRRKGISSALMNEVFTDWNSHLLYTNYAPNAKLLFDKSNKFELLDDKKGVRLYFNFQIAKLLAPRSTFLGKIKPILKIIDWLLNIITLPYITFQKHYSQKWLNKVNIADNFTQAHSNFIEKHNISSFKREDKEYWWIFKYPWISTIVNNDKYYPFSSIAKIFYYKFITISNNDNNIVGLAIIKNRDRHITIPYFMSEKGFSNDLAKGVIAFCHKNRATMLTCYTKQCLKSINMQKASYIGKKTMHQKYFISKKLNIILNNANHKAKFTDGDGDCVFT